MMTEESSQACVAEVLTLRGEDAATFATSQLASKVDEIDTAHWQWTAWLDAGGKVRMLGMLWKDQADIHILLRGGQAARLRAAMQMYVLRSRVELTPSNHGDLAPGDALPHRQLLRHKEHLSFGLGEYSLRLSHANESCHPQACSAASRHAIVAGHPWLPENALDALLPPALGLYTLGAVALGKGCYPGQEMVNRLHTRGGHKYVMAHLETGDSWRAGESLSLDEAQVGTVLLRADQDALLVARAEALDALPNSRLIRQFPA